MKLALTYYGRERKGLWSGTLDVFDKLFPKQKNVSDVKWVRIFPCISIVYQKFLVLYSKLFYTSPGICREKQMSSLTVKTAIRNIKKIKCDWVLMVAEHCLTDKFPRDRKYALTLIFLRLQSLITLQISRALITTCCIMINTPQCRMDGWMLYLPRMNGHANLLSKGLTFPPER